LRSSGFHGTNLYDEVINNKANILILDISMPKKRWNRSIKEFTKGYPAK
jgi:hypothetical protein